MSFGFFVFGMGMFLMMATMIVVSEVEKSQGSSGVISILATFGFTSFFILSFALAMSELIGLWNFLVWGPVVAEYNRKLEAGEGSMEIDYGPYGVLRLLPARVAGVALSALGAFLLVAAVFVPRWVGAETSFEVPWDGIAVARFAVMSLSSFAIMIGLVEAADGRSNSGRPIGLG